MVKNLPANAGDIRTTGSIPVLGRSPGGGHGNPFQYSCLENPLDRRAWRATVHRVTKSQTQLKQLSTHVCTMSSQWPTGTKGNGPSCLIPYCSWLHYTGQALLPLLFLDSFPPTYSHGLLTHLFQVLAQMPFSQRRLSWPSCSTRIAWQCYTPYPTLFSSIAFNSVQHPL